MGVLDRFGRFVDCVARWVVLHSSRILWAVVAVGALLRLARYLDNRSLWLDEAFLAINLKEKSFSELLGQLEFLQSAPAGFLLAEKAAVTLFGDSEYALRLLPLAASLVALALFAYVARRLLSPPVALLAVALFAVNPRLLYFSSEVKPYGTDVAVALLLLALAVRAHETDGRSYRRLVPLALVAPAAVWFSFPAILVLGAIAVSLAIEPLRSRERRQVGLVAALAATWLASFGALYAVASTNVSRTAGALLENGGSQGANRAADVVQEAWSIFVDPGGFEDGTNGLAALVLIVALLALVQQRQLERLALLGLPLGIAALAALLDRYPLGGRFSLFLVPVIVLLVGRGVAAVVATSRRPLLVGALLALFLTGPVVGRATADLISPPRSEHIRPLLAHVSRNWQRGDTLYVYRNTQYAARYYGLCDDCDPSGRSFPWSTRAPPPSLTAEQFAPALEPVPPELVVGEHGLTPSETLNDVDGLPAGRVWLLFSHVSEHRGLDEESLILVGLEERGTQLESRVELGAALYLYELSEG
ncbi:MAG: glycosyltransferase family 39 protein [Gaiellaceae bacterium MAG52_C11]|nr:glycosyltransferase family 39 protein [Candidatus Gaiellasilicea maunaloa]